MPGVLVDGMDVMKVWALHRPSSVEGSAYVWHELRELPVCVRLCDVPLLAVPQARKAAREAVACTRVGMGPCFFRLSEDIFHRIII